MVLSNLDSIYTHMKKSELTQLTQIIEVLVTREVRKQLPKLIGEVFSNMTGKAMVTEHIHPARKEYVGMEVEAPSTPKDPHEFRASLKDLFAGVLPTKGREMEEGVRISPPKVMRNYTKDPVLNKVLNETTADLRSREGLGGMAAIAGGFSPGAPVDMGQIIQPTSTTAILSEGHVPLSNMPEGVSALDVAKAGLTPAPITEVLTNYDRMKKILEASKGKRY
jgi:hypothetical protein